MKVSKKNLTMQRKILDKRLKEYQFSPIFLQSSPPRRGWIKAVRGALGLSANSLAKKLGCAPQSILSLEAREANQSVTLDSMNKMAKVMGCRLIYAIVPEKGYENFESIVDEKARKLAEKIVKGISHHMALENQQVDEETIQEQTKKLVLELKEKLDPKIWEE